MASRSEISGWIVILITISAIVLFASFVAIEQGSHERAALKRVCIDNLPQIDGAKQQWASERKKVLGDKTTTADILPYLGRTVSTLPVCPARGIYELGVVGENPKCSVPGHALPKSGE
jgi:hypothetical protein